MPFVPSIGLWSLVVPGARGRFSLSDLDRARTGARSAPDGGRIPAMGENAAIDTVQMETRGPVPEGAIELARDRVTVRAEHGRPRLAMAQANLDVDGRPVRAQAVAETMWRAVNELRDRLLIRLARVSRDWPVRRGGRPLTTPREWRPSGVPGRRAPELAPPDRDRYVVRHKVIKPFLATPLEAALDMELLDYDFYLFTDAVTGDECVIDRNSTKYRVIRLIPAANASNGNGGPGVIDHEPVPVLTPAQALCRLTAQNLAYVFF